MARLPVPGSDAGTWGDILNTYLSVSHAADGTLSSGVVGSTQLDKPSAAGGMLLSGLLSARPTAASTNANLYYFATDVNGGTLYQSNGSSWTLLTSGVNHNARHNSGGADALTGNLDANARVAVSKAGTAVGTRRGINFIEGSNVTITTTDNSGSERVDVTIAGPATITKRETTLTDAATVTPNCATTDIGKLTSLSQATTIANPSGTPAAGQQLQLRIKSAATQTLTFGTNYRGSNDCTLPTATTGSDKTDYFGFQYNADDGKWDLLAKNMGF